MERTCGKCVNLICNDVHMGGKCYGCKVTGFVIPHSSNPKEATFWRVPISCPRPNTEVVKSEAKAPRQDWITIKHDEFHTRVNAE